MTSDEAQHPFTPGGKKFGCGLPKEAAADDKNFRIHSVEWMTVDISVQD
jgi:hypothetical protein